MTTNLFAACRIDGAFGVKRVRLTQDVQHALTDLFSHQEQKFFQDVTDEVTFDGDWKPDANELLTVDAPAEAAAIVEAVQANITSIADLGGQPTEGIRAMFTGLQRSGKTRILLQAFNARQILTRGFALLLDGQAFKRLSEPAFTLDNKLVGVIEDGKLKFRSLHNIKMVFDLTTFYREATDQELRSFALLPALNISDLDEFKAVSDQTVRKLVHAIMKSEILAHHGADAIASKAATIGLIIECDNGKLIVPKTRAEIKNLLRFLDDGYYRAPLSGDNYVTNSKRKVTSAV